MSYELLIEKYGSQTLDKIRKLVMDMDEKTELILLEELLKKRLARLDRKGRHRFIIE